MPSSPKILKERILEHALQMIIREGYSALNITALAQEIGCSTQPISWHFKSMEGLRKALRKYALHYAEQKQQAFSNGIHAFYDAGVAYVDIAFDEPNLFKYLYMSADSGQFTGNFDTLMKKEDNAALTKLVVEHMNMSEEKTRTFCRNMIIYTHGLASFIAAGIITATKQEVHEMMHQNAQGFLQQMGEENGLD